MWPDTHGRCGLLWPALCPITGGFVECERCDHCARKRRFSLVLISAANDMPTASGMIRILWATPPLAIRAFYCHLRYFCVSALDVRGSRGGRRCNATPQPRPLIKEALVQPPRQNISRRRIHWCFIIPFHWTSHPLLERTCTGSGFLNCSQGWHNRAVADVQV